jgi:hypothetical protein
MQPIPIDQHIHALQRQRARIERHLEHCRAAAANGDSPNPPLGRELDDACASLARVQAELTWLRHRGSAVRATGTPPGVLSA